VTEMLPTCLPICADLRNNWKPLQYALRRGPIIRRKVSLANKQSPSPPIIRMALAIQDKGESLLLVRPANVKQSITK
jgi:hypothetical protein